VSSGQRTIRGEDVCGEKCTYVDERTDEVGVVLESWGCLADDCNQGCDQ